MTTQQLIAELEKRGVLTWVKGDCFQHPQDGSEWIVQRTYENGLGQLILQPYVEDCRPGPQVPPYHPLAEHCTHSADDPRLLGRVLRELEGHCFFEMDLMGETEILVKNESFIGEMLEAALKALLKKVEGEQS
jgi:hypothetical protein